METRPVSSAASNPPIPRRIQVLSQEVVNRIAAGEVIVRPANAIKEMVENSLDAGATSIKVIVKDGGLKQIQITDNGSGIKKEDLHLVCERFATSKIGSFDDLQSLCTFGFRGEALASISHIAHVSVVSMTRDSPCAYKAHYANGELVSTDGSENVEPQPCAGTVGTTITVEDLFFNVPSRRKALKSPSEEYQRIVDVISKYALHYSGVAFNVKRHGENRSEVNTARGASLKDNIRLLHGPKVATELVDISVDMDKYDAKLKGFVTGPNYNTAKKMVFILFINNRLVDCAPLKRAIDAVYSNMFQRGVHPFVYMSLMFPPQKIDQNIHPTKSEVRFLHQDEIISEVVAQIAQELERVNLTRSFDVEQGSKGALGEFGAIPDRPNLQQSTLHDSMDMNETAERFNGNNNNTTPEKSPTPKYQHQMVRTDSRMQTLDSFISPSKSRSNLNPAASQQQPDSPMKGRLPSPPPDQMQLADENEIAIEEDVNDMNPLATRLYEDSRAPSTTEVQPSAKFQKFSASSNEPLHTYARPSRDLPAASVAEEFRKRKRRPDKSQKPKLRLTSISNLIRRFEENQHNGVRDVLSNYSFVGCFDSTRALIQFETRLFLCNITSLRYEMHNLDLVPLVSHFQSCSRELAYQEALHRFSEFEEFEFAEPLLLEELAQLGIDARLARGESVPKGITAKSIVALLNKQAELLKEYFSITIDTAAGTIDTVPLIIGDDESWEYPPYMGNLPAFLVDLADQVDWTQEQPCLNGICRCLAKMYALHPRQFLDAESEESEVPMQHWVIEHVLLPSMRLRFSPPKEMAKDGSVIQLTSLEKLYKVFERC